MNLDMEAGDGIREQQHGIIFYGSCLTVFFLPNAALSLFCAGKTAEWIRCLRSIGPLANSTTEGHGSVG
jgi:hypothetical protein